MKRAPFHITPEAKRWIIKWPHRLTLNHCTSCSVIIIIVLWWHLIGVFHLENKNWNFKCSIVMFKLGFFKNVFYLLPGKVNSSSQFPLSLHLLTTDLFTVLYPKPFCVSFPHCAGTGKYIAHFRSTLIKQLAFFSKESSRFLQNLCVFNNTSFINAS